MLGKITVAVFFLLLIWGNLVAGLGYGLACPDWPLCYGQFIPPLRINVFMEWMHRNLGAIASIFLLVLVYKRIRSYAGGAKLIPVLTLLLLVFQIVLGGIVVLLELPVNVTTVHFGVAIVIFSLVFYMAYFDGKTDNPKFRVSGTTGIFLVLSLVVFFQAVLGAYVRHSGSGLACPDWPTCLGYWIPPELSGTVLIHFLHRFLAYGIFIAVILLYVFSFSKTRLAKNRSKILGLLALILIQIILGILTVSSKLFYVSTAFHLSGALLILMLALYTWFEDMSESHV